MKLICLSNKTKIYKTFTLFILGIIFDSLLIIRPIRAIEEAPILDTQLNASPYIIGPGDVIKLSIYGEPQISGTYQVLNDGSIPIPFSGNIFVKGYDLINATEIIKNKLQEQLINPTIQLKIEKARPIRISVIGEVERPGIYSLTTTESSQTQGFNSLNISGLPTVVDAIQKSGGITQNANLSQVELLRLIPNKENEYKKTNLNLLKLIFEGKQIFNPYLFDGDILRINKASQAKGELISLAQSNLSPQRISVYFVGEVNNPGKIELISNTPLVQGILAAGGPINWRGNKGKVLLVRMNKNGSISKKRYKLNLGENVSKNKNPILKNGDTIIVTRTSLAVGSDALNAISSPVSNAITALTLFKLVGD